MTLLQELLIALESRFKWSTHEVKQLIYQIMARKDSFYSYEGGCDEISEEAES